MVRVHTIATVLPTVAMQCSLSLQRAEGDKCWFLGMKWYLLQLCKVMQAESLGQSFIERKGTQSSQVLQVLPAEGSLYVHVVI